MRVNVYAEELTDRVEIIAKEIEGQSFTGLRFYLELPATVGGKTYQGPFLHKPGDDDSAAVTFWGKRSLRKLLVQALAELDNHYHNLAYALIKAERRRQRDEEKFTPEHDERYPAGTLLAAGRCYLASGLGQARPEGWPWDEFWWKPRGPKEDLIRGGALFMAEMEVAARRGEVEPLPALDLMQAAEALKDVLAGWLPPGKYADPTADQEPRQDETPRGCQDAVPSRDLDAPPAPGTLVRYRSGGPAWQVVDLATGRGGEKNIKLMRCSHTGEIHYAYVPAALWRAFLDVED